MDKNQMRKIDEISLNKSMEGKGENVGHHLFLLFPYTFQKPSGHQPKDCKGSAYSVNFHFM